MALCLSWPLESTGTPVSIPMACSTTTRTLTDSALLTGVTRLVALLQPLTSPPKVPIADFAFKLATSTECQLWHGINLDDKCTKNDAACCPLFAFAIVMLVKWCFANFAEYMLNLTLLADSLARILIFHYVHVDNHTIVVVEAHVA